MSSLYNVASIPPPVFHEFGWKRQSGVTRTCIWTSNIICTGFKNMTVAP